MKRCWVCGKRIWFWEPMTTDYIKERPTEPRKYSHWNPICFNKEQYYKVKEMIDNKEFEDIE